MKVNYGDVNPFVHGGLWLEQLADGDYEVIRLNTNFEANQWEVDRMVVCPSDSWIEAESVRSFCDAQNEEQFVIGLIDYYGPQNFGSMYPDTFNMETEEDSLIQFLTNNKCELAEEQSK